MDITKVLKGGWEFFQTIIGWASSIWDWLYSDVTIGSWTFKPLLIGGGVMVALIASWLIGKIIGWVIG